MNKPIPTYRDPWARWAKIIFAIVVCATLLALAGCHQEEDPAPLPTPGTPVSPATRALPPVLFVDNETGCHYLSSGGADTPLAPRMERRNATQAWLTVLFAVAAVLAAWAVPS